MKSHSSIRVVKRWHGLLTDPVRGCFNDPEALNNGYLPSGRGPRVHKLANGLRLGIAVSSQDLSEAWVTIHG
jgi:hypothetical protein